MATPLATDSQPVLAGARDPTHPRFALTRSCHIFSAAVRETLEVGLLEEVAENGLTHPQFCLLKFILLTNGHQLHEIAEFLGITPSAATKTVDKLERLGLVVRMPCKEDRRAILLVASEEGRLLVERFEAHERERIDRVADEFTSEELSTMSKLLERTSLALIASDGARGHVCLRCSGYFDADCAVRLVHGRCPYRQGTGSARDQTNEEVGG